MSKRGRWSRHYQKEMDSVITIEADLKTGQLFCVTLAVPTGLGFTTCNDVGTPYMQRHGRINDLHIVVLPVILSIQRATIML
jgi:hypothetical protein